MSLLSDLSMEKHDDSTEQLIRDGEEALAKRQDANAAVDCFLKAIEREPANGSVHNSLGVAYWQLQDTEKALEHLWQAALLNPHEASFILNCGEVLVAEGQFGRAESMYKRYLRSHPDDDKVKKALDEMEIKRSSWRVPRVFRSREEKKRRLDLKAPQYASHKLAAVQSFLRFVEGKESPLYPLDVFLEVSNVCDLKCVMCGVFSSLNPERHVNIASIKRGFFPYEALMPMETILQHALRVHCFGYGEPTIHPQFTEFVRYVSRFEVRIDFFTNGMHLTDDLVRFLVDNSVSELTVSFSGLTKQEYEHVYHGGVYEQVLGGLAKLRDYKKTTGKIFPKVSINSLSYEHHLTKFDKFVEMMADHGVNVIYLKPLIECGSYLPDLVGHSAFINPSVNEEIIRRAREIAQQRDLCLSIAPELFAETAEEEKDKRFVFSGLSPEAYATRKEFVPLEKFKEVASRMKYAPIDHTDRDNIHGLDIVNCSAEDIQAMLDVRETGLSKGDNGNFYCMEPFKTMYVMENGQTKPCCNVPSLVPALGNVNELGGEYVWKGKGFEAYRNAILNDQYPLKGCEACLKFKSGPKTHFVEQLFGEFFHWYSESFQFDLAQSELPDPLQLADGQEIYERFKNRRSSSPHTVTT